MDESNSEESSESKYEYPCYAEVSSENFNYMDVINNMLKDYEKVSE